jgi:hypothetical protein
MKKTIVYSLLPLFALFAAISATSIAQSSKKTAPTGTLETLVVANGTVAIDLDLNRIEGAGSDGKHVPLRFEAARDSFFSVLVFNDELRGPQPGSLPLVPTNAPRLPALLSASVNQLVIEKMSEGAFDLAIRDGKTGFTFFNVEGNSYGYDAATHSLQIQTGRLLIAEEFAAALGRKSDAGVNVGAVSMNASLQAIEVRKVVNGVEESAVLPAAAKTDAPEAVSPGPDVIVGDMPSMVQSGSTTTKVGLAVATTSCNAGNVELNWFALPNTDHPVIPQNLYRMSGGTTNDERFEQIGQGWMKHAFTALQGTVCGACTAAQNGTHLGVGCSDPYSTGLNGDQTGIGSRAFVNPFTGIYPSTARDHSNHTHDGTSHRVLVNKSDLDTSANPGATYFAETQYVTPHEYAWCQSHPGQCNMYNNASYRRFTVAGTTSFTFTPAAATVRLLPAIRAWTGATINQFEPAPGTDGIGSVAYKVSGPVSGVYHYEYAVYNQNLDRGIQSFSVPIGCGVTISNTGFHAPENGPGFANDGTLNSAGYSNAAWSATQAGGSVTWNSETFAQNQNANAIRWGTTYNFRFDSTQPPAAMNATLGFFKTGQPITVAIQGPSAVCTPFSLTTAVSRKTHGSAGTFDIDLPLTGSPGVECRNSGGGNHTIVITFSNTVVSGNAAVTAGTGTVSGSPTFAGNVMTVNVTGVPNVQQITLTFSGVTDSFGQTYPDTPLVMKALFGDANGNSAVSTSDIAQVKSEASNPVTQSNFREDLTADGNVSSSDVAAVKSMAGATLP